MAPRPLVGFSEKRPMEPPLHVVDVGVQPVVDAEPGDCLAREVTCHLVFDFNQCTCEVAWVTFPGLDYSTGG
jgi:hypothetical protein